MIAYIKGIPGGSSMLLERPLLRKKHSFAVDKCTWHEYNENANKTWQY